MPSQQQLQAARQREIEVTARMAEAMGVPAAGAPTHHDHNPGNFEDHFGDGGANPAPVLGGRGAEVPAPAAAAAIQQTPTIQQPPIIQQQPTTTSIICT